MPKEQLYQTPLYYLGGITFFCCILLAFDLFENPFPFVDLIAYSYLNGISTEDLRTGADFYVTQFSYVLVHYIFRFLTVWGVDPVTSSTVVFSLQSFGVMFAFLLLIKRHGISWLSAGATSLFMISCYMGLGLVVWGGPLYFSFGVMLSLISFAFYSNKQSRSSLFLGTLFALAGALTHPFSFPILILLLSSIFIFSSKLVRVSILSTLVLCILILSTSAYEFAQYNNASSDLKAAIISADLSLLNLQHRLLEIFFFQPRTSEALLGSKLISQVIFGYVAPIIVFCSVLLACFSLLLPRGPIVAVDVSSKSLATAIFLLFIYILIAPDAPFGISMWPQRLLLAILPLSFALLTIYVNRLDIKTLGLRYLHLAFVTLLPFLVALHIYQLAQLGVRFKSEVTRLENVVLDSAITNAFFTFDQIDIHPFWLRSVPFALLTSKPIRDRDLYFISEWHGHAQHNIRSSAATSRLETLRMPVRHSCQYEQCAWLIPGQRFISRSIRVYVTKESYVGNWYPIWVAGKEGSGTLITVRLSDSENSFRFDQWGHKEIVLTPGGRCYGSEMNIDITLDLFMKSVTIHCNGAMAKGTYPPVPIALSYVDQLGVNNVTRFLGGVVPLADFFPGVINENFSKSKR